MTTFTASEVVAKLRERFASGNDVPVPDVRLTRAEFDVIADRLEADERAHRKTTMVDKALMQLIAIDRDQASRNSTWRDLLNQNASALEAAIKQCERDAKDAARYRWWRRNARAIEQDEAGLDGLAFNSQVPLETIENASDEELFDLIADAAMAEESGQ